MVDSLKENDDSIANMIERTNRLHRQLVLANNDEYPNISQRKSKI